MSSNSHLCLRPALHPALQNLNRIPYVLLSAQICSLFSVFGGPEIYREIFNLLKSFPLPSSLLKNNAMKYADSKSLLNPKEAHQAKELVGDSLKYPLI